MAYIGSKPADKVLTASDITDGIISSAKIADGTIVNDDVNASAAIVASKLSGTGITVADQWRITTAHSGTGDITTNWERMDTDNQGLIGSAMTESSGVFTFPSTGTYLVTFVTSCDISGGDVTYLFSEIWITLDNSNYSATATVAGSAADGYRTGNNVTVLLNVSDTSNVKCKFKVNGSAEDFNANGSTSYNRTTAQFIRLGDST